MSEAKKRSVPAIIFSVLAILSGLMSFLTAGLQGRRAGWEMLIIFAAPAVICAVIALVIRRNGLTYTALGFGILGVLGLFLGA
jgi:energy-converting hydrogenase Eha subunit A